MTAGTGDDPTSDLAALEVERDEGPPPPPTRRPGRRRLPAIAAVVVFAVAAAAIAVLRPSPDAADDLADVIEFVSSQRTVRFSASIVSVDGPAGEEVGTTFTDRSKLTGEARLPDASHITQQSEYGAFEYIRLPDAAFGRWAEDVPSLPQEQWVRESLEDIEASASSGGSVGDVLGLMAAFDAGFDLAALLRQLESPERVEAGVLTAEATLADLLPPAARRQLAREYEQLKAEMESMEPTGDMSEAEGFPSADELPTLEEVLATRFEFTLHHGDGSRLDRLVIVAESATREELGASRTTTDLRFEEWGAAVDIAAPDASQVDTTPHIDEEGIGATPLRVLVPRDIPDGWVLTLAEVYEADGESETCHSVNLQWSPAASGGNERHMILEDPPTIEVVAGDLGCEWIDLEMEVVDGEPRQVGRRTMSLVDVEDQLFSYLSEGRGVVFDEAGARVAISSNLPEAELVLIAADLVPFDLSLQRIDPSPDA